MIIKTNKKKKEKLEIWIKRRIKLNSLTFRVGPIGVIKHDTLQLTAEWNCENNL